MGDFNGHHTLWGCEDVNNRGQQFGRLILKNYLILLNDKSHTYFHSASGTFTSIDLTLCSPSLFLDFSWKVGPDPCGSDHFPILLENDGPLLLKGFKDGSWRRQTGITSSIYAALVCTNQPLQMLMIPCLCLLPSWRTLQKKLFLRLRQYQNVSINHGFLTFAKMQSKSAEKQTIKFSSDNAEVYNGPFSMEELQDALRRAHDTSAGPDEIHYQLLKHLPSSSILLLLNIFNKIWISGDFPSDWRKAIIIPNPKPGKDPTNPTNYRPIALTSCIGKTMERMINRRLVWYLESNKLLTNVQCGFRSRRSTVDHLVRFETFCREAFIHNQHLVSVFFDLEKAYDTTWKYGIMKDLYGFGLRGRLSNFISNFLHDRSFKVWVGSTFSDSHPQEMGVPQGSILSVTLFSVKINSITQCLKPGVDCSLYVDDFQVCYRSSNMSIIERQLQLCLNKRQQWATDNGFQFSKTKTVCMHICQKRGLHLDPQPFLDKSPIPVMEETKFLGVIFDRKLFFVPHLSMLKKEAWKPLIF